MRRYRQAGAVDLHPWGSSEGGVHTSGGTHVVRNVPRYRIGTEVQGLIIMGAKRVEVSEQGDGKWTVCALRGR